MRVLLLSWEYPPVVVGGLGRHVHALATSLVDQGHEVAVVTRHADGAAYDEILEGVRVVRVPDDPPTVPFTDLLAWTMAFNHALTRAALRVAGELEPDVVHAHDWLVAHAAATVKEHLRVPLVATMHATEAGRHQGWLPGPLNRAIHSVEWWLTYEARRVVTCSAYMRWEVTRLFDLPPAKVDTVANGLDPAAFRARPAAVAAARARYGDSSGVDGPLVVYSGRLEWEKGVQVLLAAMPRLRRRHPGLRLVVAGTGTLTAELSATARRLRLGRSVTFAGQLETSALASLLGAADAAVAPSLYEPFGLVALEAAAAGTPLVVSDTGGLREIVHDGVTGLRVPPDDAPALSAALDRLLSDEVTARRLARAARAAVSSYRWPTVAAQLGDIYARAAREERALQVTLARPAPLRVVLREGNLLGDSDA